MRLQLSEFSVFEESEEDQDRFAHLFENDVAHALSIAGERVEVVDMQAVDNLVEVTYRLYVLGDQDAAGTVCGSLLKETCSYYTIQN